MGFESWSEEQFEELISQSSEATLGKVFLKLAGELGRKGLLEGVMNRKPRNKLERMYQYFIHYLEETGLQLKA